ncbi:MAG: SMC-Scp complex subunit ScpB [Pseudomonadales bacterium]
METAELKLIIEGAMLAAGRPLSLREMANLFDPMGQPDNDALRAALKELGDDCETRAYELKEVGSGFRFQVRNKYGLWISRLWEEKPPRYSRALLETLSLIAYKQPLTRGEVEDVRGVAVSTNIIRTLLERGWIRVVGHRDAPGKPALFATTREFLDYFNLKNLNELPSLADIKDIASSVNQELQLEEPRTEGRSIELPVEELEGQEEGLVAAANEDSADHTEGSLIEIESDVSDEPGSGEVLHDLSLTDVDAEAALPDSADDDAFEETFTQEKVLEESSVESNEPNDTEVSAATDISEYENNDDLVPEPDDVDPNTNFDTLPN